MDQTPGQSTVEMFGMTKIAEAYEAGCAFNDKNRNVRFTGSLTRNIIKLQNAGNYVGLLSRFSQFSSLGYGRWANS
jgi:hypothetical protein